ncbi:MFS transporter [Vibrio viridaestus]|uniref:MFS transporter n=1 Tax=Vibrio viridaestus TaxID=2487322 RepID=A0A3N9TDP7_9VIBR|nr:MFS transporter [Vibrio viridaestus]RQW61823.1 MFS transporter [Vibrio viridaestus]
MTRLLVRKLTNTVPSPVLALFVYAIAAGYSMSALPLLLPQGDLSVSVLTSWLTSSFYAGLLTGTLTSKHFIRIFGHKVSFIILQIAFALCLLGLPTWQNQYFWLFDRFVGGIIVGGIFVVIESWLLKGSAEGRRKRLSVYMSMLYAGSALGQLALTWFGANGATPFVLSSVMLVLAAVLLAVLPNYVSEPEISVVTPTAAPIGNRWVKIPALIGCLVSGILLGSVYGMMPLQLSRSGMSQEQIGSLMAVIIIGAMLVQPVISALSKKVGRTLLMSMFALLGAMSIGVFEQMLGEQTISMFLLGMAIFAFYPIAINLGSSSIPEEHMVSASQQMILIYSFGSIVGPIGAQYFMDTQTGLFGFFFIVLITTCIYMLFVALKSVSRVVIHK